MSEPVDIIVRPPWPDEIPRLKKHFGLQLTRKGYSNAWLWVLSPVSGQRVLGLVQMLEMPKKLGLIEYKIRPKWMRHEIVQDALMHAVNKAVELDLPQIACQTDPTEPVAQHLHNLGFVDHTHQEQWVLSIKEGIRSTLKTVDAIIKRYPIEIENLSEASLPEAAALCEQVGLLSRDRVRLATSTSRGFHAPLSFVTRNNGKVTAVLLTHMQTERPYIEVVAEHPDPVLAHPAALAAMLRSFFVRADQDGVLYADCLVRQDSSSALPKFMSRGGGKIVRRLARFDWTPSYTPF